ncbi:MAG: DNA polymerase III subunit delta' [Deltaproteobacteria bacterium]|nr:DNA polymerase III subunit delta' [Deltaproteobacteria bacterium]
MTDVITFKPFSQIIGQERAIGFLKRVMTGEKIPHAYMFTGIPGVGKATTAMAMTQAVNCDEPLNGEGCGRCRSCRQVMNGNFADLIFVEPDGQNIKIEQIRDINRTLCFKPVSGRYRVCIIRKAELMTEEAANSFLKTLEEPPPGNILVLKVVESLDLLPTIVSRCQKIPFQPLPVRLIAEWLRNEKDMDEENASVAANLSEGSLGRAIHICDSDFFEERQDFISRLIQLPGLSSEQALEMAMEYSGKAKKKVSDASDKSYTGLFDLLGIWKTWYRDLILMKVKGPADLLLNRDFSRKLKNISKNFKTENLIDSFFIVDQAQRDLIRNPNIGLMMENTVLALKRLSSA